jgi:hypothetical protein
MDSGCPLKSTSTHNSHNSGSYERFSAGSIISWIRVDLPLNAVSTTQGRVSGGLALFNKPR